MPVRKVCVYAKKLDSIALTCFGFQRPLFLARGGVVLGSSKWFPRMQNLTKNNLAIITFYDIWTFLGFSSFLLEFGVQLKTIF